MERFSPIILSLGPDFRVILHSMFPASIFIRQNSIGSVQDTLHFWLFYIATLLNIA